MGSSREMGKPSSEITKQRGVGAARGNRAGSRYCTENKIIYTF